MGVLHKAAFAVCLLTTTAAFAQTAPQTGTATPATPGTAAPMTPSATPAPAAPGTTMAPGTTGAGTTRSTEGPGNPAVKDPAARTVTAPVEGANSFTEGQARSRIEGQGYSNVTGLAKGDDGVWRGKAAKGGATVEVAVDFKGNVTSK